MACSVNNTEHSTKMSLCNQVLLINAKNKTVQDESYAVNALKRLHEQFKDEEFCDVTLVFGKSEIKAHKVVLASSSRYFKAMFSSNFIDGTQQRLEIPVLEESIGEALIEFAYSGQIEITSENVLDLLAGANFLEGFQFVEKSCCDYLKFHTGKHNVFHILDIADRYHQKTLKKSCKTFITNNFVDCIEGDHDSFLNIHSNLLIEIMSKNKLIIVNNGNVLLGRAQEEFLLKHALEYLDHNHEKKLKPEHILKCIHLPLLKKQSLQALKSNPVLKDTNCLAVIEEALKLKKTKKTATEKSKTDWAQPRPCGEYQQWIGRCLANGGEVNTKVDTFDDKDKISIEKDYVVGMELWMSEWANHTVIAGIKVHYSNGQKAMHGSNKGEQKKEFQLEPNEKIVKIDSQSGCMVDNLTFYTNKERKLGPFGGPGGSFRHETPPGCHGYLAFIKGTVVNTNNGLGITRLQFVWRFFRFPGQKHVQDYVEPVYFYDEDDYDEDDYDEDGYNDYDDYNDYDYLDYFLDHEPEYDDWSGFPYDIEDEVDGFDEDWAPDIQPYQFEPLADPTEYHTAPDNDDDDECTDGGVLQVHQSSHDADDEHTADDCWNPEHGSD